MIETRTPRWLTLAIWLATALLTAWVSLAGRDSGTLDGTVVPMGNDAFYHAARIVDASGEAGLIQFDEKTHAPEGSWINWPWGYTTLAATALRVATLVNPEVAPMAFLAWIPVLFVFVNAALFISIGTALRLPASLLAVAGLTFALSATVQSLHLFANIDHHFVELAFILGAILATLRWLRQADRAARAATLGIVLGLAPAFHTGAFILQLPLLATLFLLWTRNRMPPLASVRAFAVALVVTSFAILLPSASAWDGQFAIYTLSLFHGYVAICTAAVCLLLATVPMHSRSLAALVFMSLMLSIPLLGSLLLGGQFLAGDLPLFRIISEVQSPVAQLLDPNQRGNVLRLHSWLLLATPLVAAGFVWQIVRFVRGRVDAPAPATVAFAVAGLFGLVLMCLQQRLLYYGIAPLYLGVAQWFAARPMQRLRAPIPAVLALGLLAITAQPQLRHQLFKDRVPGLDRNYAVNFGIFDKIRAACAADPGLVISHNNDGHPLRYHSDCSVLVNNMIITRQHAEKLKQMFRLITLSPAAFLAETPPETKYLYVRLDGVLVFDGERVGMRSLDRIRKVNPPLFLALAEGRAAPPPGFELIAEIRLPYGHDLALSQFWRVTPTN